MNSEMHYGQGPAGETMHTGRKEDCVAPDCYLPAEPRFPDEQEMPVPNNGVSIQSLVRDDLIKREQLGISRYGTSLQAGNGRDALRDAYEEAIDLACYLRQEIEERKLAGGGTSGGSPREVPIPFFTDADLQLQSNGETVTPSGRYFATGSEAEVRAAYERAIPDYQRVPAGRGTFGGSPRGLCGDRSDHDPHQVTEGSLAPYWCTADQSRREPLFSERVRGETAGGGTSDSSPRTATPDPRSTSHVTYGAGPGLERAVETWNVMFGGTPDSSPRDHEMPAHRQDEP